MLIDAEPFDAVAKKKRVGGGIAAWVEFIERKLGVRAVYDKRRVPYGRIDLVEPFEVAAALTRKGIVEWYAPSTGMPDEPPIRLWTCRLNDTDHNFTGGASVDDDEAALYAALAEGLERYIWWMERDYFQKPFQGTVAQAMARSSSIAPERFAAFSQLQREQAPRLRLLPEASYLWIQGLSLVTGKNTYVPAQTVSAAHRPWSATPQEPLIRTQITTGLATWPTKTGARLSGALECLEREAYMITWFNQLTCPRARISGLRQRSQSLDHLIARCEQYALKVHIIPMPTDAPTHAVMAVLEDLSPIGPRFTLGLKAHRSLTQAAEGAILEGLRARRFTRRGDRSKEYDETRPVDEIGHRGRVYYWWEPEHAPGLEFLISGEEKDFEPAPWETDSPEEHLERIVRWCHEKGYECVSVPLGSSHANPMPWHIEVIVIPELQPTHLHEKWRHLGGTRLSEVPRAFGYTPRETPFTDAPHPYC